MRVLQLLIVGAGIVFATTIVHTTLATSVGTHDWLNNDYTLSSNLGYTTDYYTNKLCYDALVNVAGYDDLQEGCVFSGPNYEVLRSWSYMAIRFGSESQFYQIVSDDDEPLGRNWMYIVPGHDTLVYYRTVNEETVMAVYDNFSKKLTKVSNGGHPAYRLAEIAPSFALHDSEGSLAPIVPYTTTHSNSGRYALVDLAGGGIVRIDVLEHSQRAITGLRRDFSLDMWPWDTSMAASDDGKYIAVGGDYSPDEIRIYQLSGECGDEYVDTLSVADVCPKTSIPYEELQSVGHAYPGTSSHMVYFDSYDNVIAYFSDYDTDYFGCEVEGACPWNAGLKITMGSTGTQTALLDYLAIGDSYTSGEGDVTKDNVSHYLPLTDYVGGCHLSSRSYPFLLRNYWGIAATKMHSVACSGARVNEDYLSTLSSYLGQSSQLTGLSVSSKTQSQTNALQNFTPGVIPQLEFIRTYKPKIVTLTGGGNDVGFGSIIKDCAVSYSTCNPAMQNSPNTNIHKSRIESSYNDVVRLLQRIKSLSPASKIYVIGYPQFIKNGVCANSGLLNAEEITMINDSVSRLNTVLARAAQNAGVEFVSVEDSLVGGRLCEGSAYMTGVLNSFLSTWNPGSQSSFHPNAAGHQKMAESIKNQTGTRPPRLQNSDTYVNDFGSIVLDKIAIVNYMTITTNVAAAQGKTIQISLPPLSLLAGSVVKLFLHSDPLYLGSLVVDEDGSLSGTLTMPSDAPLGSHTLILEGASYSGEPLTYYQGIEVQSSNPDDRDADGIPNIYDKCDFIPYWFDETSGKDICAPNVPLSLQQSNVSTVTTGSTTTTDEFDSTLSNDPIGSFLQRSADHPVPATASSTSAKSSWLGLMYLMVLIALLGGFLFVLYSNRKNHHE